MVASTSDTRMLAGLKALLATHEQLSPPRRGSWSGESRLSVRASTPHIFVFPRGKLYHCPSRVVAFPPLQGILADVLCPGPLRARALTTVLNETEIPQQTRQFLHGLGFDEEEAAAEAITALEEWVTEWDVRLNLSWGMRVDSGKLRLSLAGFQTEIHVAIEA